MPFLRRDVIEHITQFDSDLIYGWGNDVYSGIVCEENNWKVGVVDLVSAVHVGGGTIKATNSSTYNSKANQGMISFFQKKNMIKKLEEFRYLARTYKI